MYMYKLFKSFRVKLTFVDGHKEQRCVSGRPGRGVMAQGEALRIIAVRFGALLAPCCIMTTTLIDTEDKNKTGVISGEAVIVMHLWAAE